MTVNVQPLRATASMRRVGTTMTGPSVTQAKANLLSPISGASSVAIGMALAGVLFFVTPNTASANCRVFGAPGKASKTADAHIWLEQIYAAVANNQIDAAIDLMFEKLDDLLLGGKTQEVNEILLEIDVTRLGSHLMVGLLSVTKTDSDALPNRRTVVRRIRDALTIEAPDRVDRLLARLS